MKILVWNIQDLYITKIRPPAQNNRKRKRTGKSLSNYVAANTIKDFIAKVVGCEDTWQQIPFLTPATGAIDIFVIIEVEEATFGAGQPVLANFTPLMQDLVAAINIEAATNFHLPIIAPVYDYVREAGNGGSIVSTGDETVGIIYNTLTVTYQNGGIMTDATAVAPGHLAPRTPFWATFQEVGNAAAIIDIVANHAPPTSLGGVALRYQNPIDYANFLQFCINAAFSGGAQLAQVPVPAPPVPSILVVGDFNCSITHSYVNGAAVTPFTNLYVAPPPAPNAHIRMGSVMGDTSVGNPDNMLTSARNKLQSGNASPFPKTSYLNEEYDDIVYTDSLAPNIANSGVLDLIGLANDYNGNPLNFAGQNHKRFSSWVKVFNQISDHLPVAIQY